MKMKKLAIFGLAMMLVFGMSVVSMANTERGTLKDSATVENNLDVNVTIDKYAKVITPDTALNLNLAAPGSKYTSNTVNVSVEANTPVEVKITENIAQNMQSDIGLTNAEIWNGGSADFSEHVLSPNFVVVDPTTGASGTPIFDNSAAALSTSPVSVDDVSRELTLNSDNTNAFSKAGKYTFGIYAESEWREGNTPSWWEAKAGTYTGNVYFTVSAAN